MLLALSSPVKFSKRVVSVWNFVQSLYYKTISVSHYESLEIRLFAVNWFAESDEIREVYST